MKPLYFLALAVIALSAPAQEVKIIGIDQSGTITWSNSATPLHCGVEAKWDMRHTWLPLLDWNVLAGIEIGTIDNITNWPSLTQGASLPPVPVVQDITPPAFGSVTV